MSWYIPICCSPYAAVADNGFNSTGKPNDHIIQGALEMSPLLLFGVGLVGAYLVMPILFSKLLRRIPYPWLIQVAGLGIALVMGMLLAALRLFPEIRLIRSTADAQEGIALSYAIVIAIVTTLLASCLTFGLLVPRRIVRFLCLALLLSCLGYNLYKLRSFRTIQEAMHVAGNPATSSDDLQGLLDFKTYYFGYELDNRLAANPSSPAELLWSLYKKNQEGTNMAIAQNPNSPPTLLRELGRTQNIHVKKLLSDNPTYIEMLVSPVPPKKSVRENGQDVEKNNQDKAEE